MSKDAHQTLPCDRVISTIAPLTSDPLPDARVAKSVDARDLKSLGLNRPCRFESGSGHQRDSARIFAAPWCPVISRNHASLTNPAQVGALLRAIDGYEGQPITAGVLKLAPLVFLRPGELRGARWAEFDLDGAEWRIPRERMKMGDPHVVPLARHSPGSH